MSPLRFLSSLCLTVIILAAPTLSASESALWVRYPSISPDGSTIVFSYRGDLWTVPSTGGSARALTTHEAHDFMPVWSPDGSKLAFASNRFGNFDVFVMPSTGGPATRLTFHSASDYPTSFAPDSRSVLFSSGRLDSQTCVQYPRRGSQPELYRVAVGGGMPEQVLSTPAIFGVFDSSGKRLAYSDQKGLESQWRKHDNSSFARDVWIWELDSNSHTRLTELGADDRQPVWSPDEQGLFFLSERSGSFNIWRQSTQLGSEAEQLTFHTKHPVRFLSVSTNGDLCYSFDGEVWLQKADSSTTEKLEIFVEVDGRHNSEEWTRVADDISEFTVSPDSKEIAFIARGEVFVTATDHGDTRRITNTPEQERSISFSPDGRSLLYASERNGSWNIYRSDLTDKEEPSFFNATAITESPVLVTENETFQPNFSPDGKEIAYLEERVELKVLNLESGESRIILPADINYSYADGDQWYQWSPDGKWFLVDFLSPQRWSSEVGLVPASGETGVINLTKSGYEDVIPRWAHDGEAVVWLSDRHGDRMQAGWSSQYDVYEAFFTRDAWDNWRLNSAEKEQYDEKKKAEKKKNTQTDNDDEDDEEEDEGLAKLPDPVNIELDGLKDRMTRLTLHSADLAEAALTPDGEKLLYVARFEKGFDLWIHEPRKSEIKLLAKLKAKRVNDLVIDKKGKKAFVLADNQLKSVEIEGGKVKPVKLSATMKLEPFKERKYLFEHAWRQTEKKFYVEDMAGVDWDFYKGAYARFLPHIDNNWDFAELISELQGELNASHLGCRYRPTIENADQTATLGIFPDTKYQGPGIKVLEIIEGGPFSNTDTKVKAGVIIEAINSAPIAAGANWYSMLNHEADHPVRFSLNDPTTGDRWQEVVKPISLQAENELLYQRWIRSRRAEVDRLSGGRLGYAHIRTMNDSRYREVFEEVFGLSVEKDGIVLDTRFNNGGNLVEALTTFLTGEVYARAFPRGRQIGEEPSFRWTKPSVVVMNEGNYSDAHCFPAAYSSLGIGEMVGMPVPGTCTSVWWENLQDSSLTFGIPMVGYLDNDGDLLENKHLPPDHMIDNDPALEGAGRDQQLEKAVEVLLAKLDG